MTVTLKRVGLNEVEKVVACFVDAFWEDGFTNYINGVDLNPDHKESELANGFRIPVYDTLYRGGHAIVIEDSDSPGEYLGAAVWLPPDAKPESFFSSMRAGGWRIFLKSREIRKRMVVEFLQQSEKKKKLLMAEYNNGGKYWYLNLLGTTKKGRGRGFSKLLINYGTEKADEEEIVAYVESSTADNAKYIYSPHGFEEVDQLTIKNGEYLIPCMIRKPQKK